jgi:predicted TIM-barrel fold metal-dependent hydrolase
MRIDVHTHYNPGDYFAELDRIGAITDMPILKILGHLWLPSAKKNAKSSGARAEASGPEALARRVADMDSAGVDLQIISIGAAHPYVSDPAQGAHLTSLVNDSFREVVDLHPARFRAFGCLPLPHIDAAVAEAKRVLDDPAFAGVALGGSALGAPLDEPQFAPLWNLLNEREAVVYIHPGVAIDGVVGCLDYHLAPDFVSPTEMAVAGCRYIASGHLDRYPSVRFVFATLGGSIPFLARRFDRGLQQDNPEARAALGGSVLPHLKRFWYDTSVIEEPTALRAAVETYGADRLMLGSDYARPGVSSLPAIKYVTESPYLTDEEKHLVLDVTAAQVLRIPHSGTA